MNASSRLTALLGSCAVFLPVTSNAESVGARLKLADGLIWEDPAGGASARLTARAMADYRHYLDSGAKADTFSVRRARIGLGFNLNQMFGGFVESELAFGNSTNAGTASTAGLLQGFMEWSPSPKARLRIGQFKPQFTLEASMSPFQIEFQERSLMFNLLQNFLYDRGVMLHGSPLPATYYGISYTNGTGVNVDEFQRSATEAAAGNKDITLRVTANAAAWMSLPDTVVHVGVSAKRGDVANGDATTSGYSAASGITEARGLVFFNPASFNSGSALAAPEIERTLGAVEAAVAYKQFKLQAEYARVAYAGVRTDGVRFEPEINAGYVTASWLLSGEHFSSHYRNGVFTRINPLQAATNDHPLGGAWQASIRYSLFDGSDFKTTNLPLTGVLGTNTLSPSVSRSASEASAWTLAIKWMPTPYTSFMANYVRTTFDTPVVANGITLDNEHAVTLRAQFDFF